ncbi:unnamed protein product [Effrenium voratum]|nr:unnamed protein product [Effrenium voratum]
MGDKEDSSIHVPPPMELGNYKGVMLCNRPAPTDGLKPELGAHPPFRSAIPATVGDAAGLSRKRPVAEVKKRGPSAALRRHCRWIKELQQQVAEDAQLVEHEEIERDRRQQVQKEVFRKQREAIRLIKMGCGASEEELSSALNPKAKKPLWAMTEAEKEDKEDVDAGELINFAEQLDFDEYIHDLEFRGCLAAITDRAKRLQREQEAFKESLLKELNQDEETASTAKEPQAVLRAPDVDRPDWDARPPSADSAKALAEKAYQEGGFKAVHSKASLKKIAEREVQEAFHVSLWTTTTAEKKGRAQANRVTFFSCAKEMLVLSSNLADPAGVEKSFSTGLSKNKSLKSLCLAACRLQDAGVGSLCKGPLTVHPTQPGQLEHVSFNYNRLNDAVISSVVQMLSTNTKLQYLELCGNSLTPAAAEELLKGLKANKGLRKPGPWSEREGGEWTLGLAQNSLKAKGTEALCALAHPRGRR